MPSNSASTLGAARKLWIEGPAGRVESALRLGSPGGGSAVIAHPHPLHGGTLHNPVIFHADRELSRAGMNTLRFNFRGVGQSEGTHDAGRGEVDDLAAAVRWLRGLAPSAPLVLVGYSFGAWCAVRYALTDRRVAGVIAIGIPVRIYPFQEIRDLRCPVAIVQGSEDEFGTPDEVRALLEGAGLSGRVLVVPGSSHLFPGKASLAAALVVEAASSFLSRPSTSSAS